jgi:tetratricopeptide (TPR) repeat protein
METRASSLCLIIFVAAAQFASPLPVFASGSQSKSDLKRAKYLLVRCKYREAITEFTRIIERDQNCAGAYDGRARAYLNLEKSKEALSDINRAIAINPNQWSYYDFRARVKYEKGDAKGAISDLDSAIKLAPKDASLYRFRAKMHSFLKDDRQALTDVTRAIAVDEMKDESSYNLRGNIYFRMGKFKLAADDYTEVIQLIMKRDRRSDKLEGAYSSRAKAYDKMGKFDLAEKDRRKVKELLDEGWGAFLDR